MKLKRLLTLVLLAMFALSMTSCARSAKNEDTSAQASSLATAGTITADASVASKEPSKITLFMSDSGIGVPDTVDPAHNDYIDKICKLANVEITEFTMPPYSDFETRLNLMLSSGKIPDVVHCYHTEAINKAGASGAFAECSKIIADSPVLSALYTDQMRDLMRYTDGNIYHIRALAAPDPGCLEVRYDLIKELNGGIIPTKLDEWYELFKKEKAKYPDSIPVSDYSTFYYSKFIFQAYGVAGSGNGWQYTFGKFIHSFEAPHMREAILFYKKLYDEGLLSPTFATNVSEDVNNDQFSKKSIIQQDNLASASCVVLNSGDIIDGSTWKVPAPCSTAGYTDIDPQNSISRIPSINGAHNVAISAKATDMDACVRFVETMLSDEVADLFVYGIEGVDYKVEDGQKVLLPAASDHSYRLLYGFMRGYNSRASIDNTITQGLFKLKSANPNADTNEIRQKIKEGTEAVYAAAKSVPSVNASDFVNLDEKFTNRKNEAKELASAIILKAILGEITMEEYDAQVTAFLKTYQPVTDEYNRLLAEVKTKYPDVD
ncbi:MAG: extracellular solute-binding protein [Clostridiaceae bacterium]